VSYYDPAFVGKTMKQNSMFGQETDRQAFTTIDDLVSLSGELFYRLCQISHYKHPLAVRKGVKQMNLTSRILRAGAITYFLDIKKTNNDKPYLMITESRYKANSGKPERNTVIVFRDKLKEFVQAVAEMSANM
jgi:hypothetical protein